MRGCRLVKLRIVGTSGSGKSRLAGEVARRTGLPRLELDEVFWDADWEFRNLDEARRAADRARSYAASPVGGGSGEPLWLLPLPCCCERRLRRFSTALPRSRITVGRSPVSEAAAGEAATRRRLDGEAELMRATQQQQQQTKGDEDDEERQEQHRSVVNGCPVVYGYVGYGAARYGLDHRKFRRLSSPPLC